jgi:hypothetical protein
MGTTTTTNSFLATPLMNNKHETLATLRRHFRCRRIGRDHARRNNLHGATMTPLALTDLQLAEIRAAALTLLPSEWPEFLRGLASRLGSEPSEWHWQLPHSSQSTNYRSFSANRIKEQTPRTSK